MIKKFRINPSLLISMVALFVALGGVSYAAATIGSAEIVNNSVQQQGRQERQPSRQGPEEGHDRRKPRARVLARSGSERGERGQRHEGPERRHGHQARTNAANADTLDGVDGSQYLRVKTRVRTASDFGEDANYGNDANLVQLSNLAPGQYVDQRKAAGGQRQWSGGDRSNATSSATTGRWPTLDSTFLTHGPNGGAAQVMTYTFLATLHRRCGQHG